MQQYTTICNYRDIFFDDTNDGGIEPFARLTEYQFVCCGKHRKRKIAGLDQFPAIIDKMAMFI